jgi:hypothetical protein
MNIVPMPEHGGEHALSQTDGRIAWEIAAEIADVPTILTRYGISPQGFKNKLKDPMFRMAIREAKALWKSDMNVKERIRVKAAMLVEDSLLDVFAIIKNENMPAASKLEAFEKLMKTADLAPKTGATQATAAGFKVVIQMGDSPSQQVTIDGLTVNDSAPAALTAEAVA